MDGKGLRKCTTILGPLETYCTLGAEIGTGKKKIIDRSWGWWSREIETAIKVQKVSCRKLREARRGNVGDKVYYCNGRNIKVQEDMKSLVRLEKKRMRKAERT